MQSSDANGVPCTCGARTKALLVESLEVCKELRHAIDKKCDVFHSSILLMSNGCGFSYGLIEVESAANTFLATSVKKTESSENTEVG